MKKRLVFFGDYGALSNARVKIMELLDQYSGCNFTGHKVFGMAPGTQLPKRPIFPWIFDKVKGIFLMKNAPLNPEYLDRLAEWGEALLWNGLDFGFVFDNRYYQTRWVKNHKFKKHPYRDNDCGVNYGPMKDAKPIYDSITFPVKYWWKKWKDIDEKKLIFQFSDVDAFGTALSLYRSEVARILVPIAKKGTGRLFIYGRNEERAGVEGDRSELSAFEKETFEDAGVAKWGRRFNRVVNRDTDTFLPRLHPSVIGRYGVNGQLGALHEVHCGSNAVVKQYLQWGYNPLKTIFSSDGWKEDQEQFVSGNRRLYLEQKHVDILFEEAVIPGGPGPTIDIAENLRRAVPVYEQITK